MGRWLATVRALGVLVLVAAGCASPAARARATAARMLDPERPPLERLLARQQLRTMTPAADPWLADAFFPIGLYDVPEEALPQIAAAGFNLVVNGGRDRRYLARAETAGVRVIPYVSLNAMAQVVSEARDQPALFAWYLFDEPDLNRMPPARYAELARRLHDLDPGRPIYLTVWSPRRYGDFIAAGDIFAPNPYPILRDDPRGNDLRMVGYVVDAARRAAGERPVWAIIQTFWAPPLWPRNPTPDELRAMVFLALNHGADGIIYFSYKSGDRTLPEHVELFRAIGEVNAELRALRGVLLVPPASPPPQQEQVRETSAAEEGEGPAEPPLDCSLRTFADLRLLIAVNPDPCEKQVRLTLPGPARTWRVQELFAATNCVPLTLAENEPLLVSFAPFQARVFLLDQPPR